MVEFAVVLLLMRNSLIRQTLLKAVEMAMTDGSYVFFALDHFGADILPMGAGFGWNVDGKSID
jgi:hypothetical protein